MTGFAAWIARVGSDEAEPFNEFMKTRQAASNAYVQGNAAPLAELATASDPATFFPPSAKWVVSAKAVAKAHRDGAKTFDADSKGHCEVLAWEIERRPRLVEWHPDCDGTLEGQRLTGTNASAAYQSFPARACRLQARSSPRRLYRQSLYKRKLITRTGRVAALEPDKYGRKQVLKG